MPVTIKKRWGHSEQVLTWFMWKALWYAQSLRRIRGSDTCSADGPHHADQNVIILGQDAHRVRPGFAVPTSLGCQMPESLSFCASLAIHGQIGAGLVTQGWFEIPTQRSDHGGDGLALGGGQSIV